MISLVAGVKLGFSGIESAFSIIGFANSGRNFEVGVSSVSLPASISWNIPILDRVSAQAYLVKGDYTQI